MKIRTAIVLLLAAAGPAAHVTSLTYTYDSFGRLHQVTYDNGTVVTYIYDLAGNRTASICTCPSC